MRPPVASRLRQVRFTSNQSNFELAVDGGERRSLIDFRTTELTVGSHELRLFPIGTASDQWRETTLRVQVPAGSGEHPIRVAMAPRPAQLSVQCNVSGTVVVKRGRAPIARGRTGEILEVPLRRLEETLRVEVSAPGYITNDDNRPQLTAGGDTLEIDVRLTQAVPEP